MKTIERLKSADFWDDALNRAIRTVCQVFLGSGVGSAATLGEVNWPLVASTTALAAIVSLATSIMIGLPETSAGTPAVSPTGAAGEAGSDELD